MVEGTEFAARPKRLRGALPWATVSAVPEGKRRELRGPIVFEEYRRSVPG
jgi:hypothetical protein